MKIQFDTPLIGTDQNGNPVQLSQDDIAALSYIVLFDTANPPTTKYLVPAANVQNATANADGSKHIVVTDKDLGITLKDNVQYFLEIQDSLGNQLSPPSAVLPFELIVTPGPVQNPTVS